MALWEIHNPKDLLILEVERIESPEIKKCPLGPFKEVKRLGEEKYLVLVEKLVKNHNCGILQVVGIIQYDALTTQNALQLLFACQEMFNAGATNTKDSRGNGYILDDNGERCICNQGDSTAAFNIGCNMIWPTQLCKHAGKQQVDIFEWRDKEETSLQNIIEKTFTMAAEDSSRRLKKLAPHAYAALQFGHENSNCVIGSSVFSALNGNVNYSCHPHL